LPDDDSRLLLVVDQFEELFSLAGSTTQQRFLKCLSNAVADPSGRLRLLITLRADFYDRPLCHREFGELLHSSTEVITPMFPGELDRAIGGPAERVGISYEAAALAEITAEVADQPNALPLLQHALTELFEQRAEQTIDLDAYRTVGGVAGALVRRADSLLDSLPGEARATARQVFLHLVGVFEGVVGTRRRVRVKELTAMPAGATPVEEVIETFGRHRLLTFDRDPVTREPTVELAHEVLLQEWPTLRAWVDERLDDLVVYRRLAAAVTEWAESGHDPGYLLAGGRLAHFESWEAATDLILTDDDERFLSESRQRADAITRRRRSLRRLITGGFAAAAVISLLLAVAAFVSMREADEEAETRRELAAISRARELAVLSVATLDDDPEVGLLLALESLATTDVPERQTVEALHQAEAASRVLWRFIPAEALSEPAHHHVGLKAFVVADAGGSIHLFDAADAQPLGVLPATGEVGRQLVSISPVTGYVAAVPIPGGGAVRVWDPARNRIKWWLSNTTPGLAPTDGGLRRYSITSFRVVSRCGMRSPVIACGP
jgi:hypothetical protein